MSEELRDVRTKVNLETDIALKIHAMKRGVDISEIAREILHEWGSDQVLISRLIQKRLRAEGIEGPSGATPNGV
jgi:hypothetical protein